METTKHPASKTGILHFIIVNKAQTRFDIDIDVELWVDNNVHKLSNYHSLPTRTITISDIKETIVPDGITLNQIANSIIGKILACGFIYMGEIDRIVNAIILIHKRTYSLQLNIGLVERHKDAINIMNARDEEICDKLAPYVTVNNITQELNIDALMKQNEEILRILHVLYNKIIEQPTPKFVNPRFW